MKKIYFTFILSSLSMLISAQTIGEESKSNSSAEHKIGLSSSFTTGVGLSYKFSKNNSQLQTVLLPYFSKENSKVGLGLAYKHKIREYNKWNISLYTGAAIMARDFDYENANKTASAGMSFDFYSNPYFSINLETGYGVYFTNKNDWLTHLSGGVGVDFNLSKLKQN